MRSARQERMDGILQSLMEDETASAQGLAARFDVSVMTVHRDLDELQRRGMVRKFHGGVSVERTGSYEIAAALRRRIAQPQKQALAAAAVGLVAPGQVVMLDDSTTVAWMADHLARLEGVRVITNYLPVLTDLAADGAVDVHAIGGDYDQGHESFLGLGAVTAVRALRVDWAFVSTTSADADGLYHQEERVVALKGAMLAGARRRALLMDSSKLGADSLHLVTDWRAVDVLLTDDAAPGGLLEQIRGEGVDVRIVPLSQAGDSAAGSLPGTAQGRSGP